MRRVVREIEDMLSEEAAKAGAQVCGVELRSKHLMITVARGGERRKIFMASTPSDQRNYLNNRALVRRAINELPEAA